MVPLSSLLLCKGTGLGWKMHMHSYTLVGTRHIVIRKLDINVRKYLIISLMM